MVEVSLHDDTPEVLLVVFSVSTTLVVVVHLAAVMVSTCILPFIMAAGEPDNCANMSGLPHEQMRTFVELAWILSTVVGIFLFLAQMAVIVWLRLQKLDIMAAACSMAIIGPAIVLFAVFSIRFYQGLIRIKYRTSREEIEKMELIIHEMENNPLMKIQHV